MSSVWPGPGPPGPLWLGRCGLDSESALDVRLGVRLRTPGSKFKLSHFAGVNDSDIGTLKSSGSSRSCYVSRRLRHWCQYCHWQGYQYPPAAVLHVIQIISTSSASQIFDLHCHCQCTDTKLKPSYHYYRLTGTLLHTATAICKHKGSVTYLGVSRNCSTDPYKY